MHQRTAGYRDQLPTEQSKPTSVYDRVMSDPESRYAYFNTTQGILYGDPLQDELRAVREILDNAAIAYLFRADENRPWPTFRAQQMTGVGIDEISRLVAEIA